MLNQLKHLNNDRLDVDELVALHTFGKQLQASYAEFQMPVPSWITLNLKSVERDIKSRDADRKAMLLSQLKTRRAQLATPDEKRRLLDEEIKALEPEVG